MLELCLKYASALERLVDLLEQQAHGEPVHASQAGAVKASSGIRAAALSDRALKFKKSSDSPAFVRVTADGFSGDIISPGQDEGELAGLELGSWVTIRIEVRGNPQESATIEIQGAALGSMKLTVKIPDNDGSNSGSTPVQVG